MAEIIDKRFPRIVTTNSQNNMDLNGGAKEWKPDYILHVSGGKFAESLDEIKAYGLEINKKVALYNNDETRFLEPLRLLTWTLSGSSLIGITYITDLSYYDNDYYTVDPGTNKPAIAVFNHDKGEIVEPSTYLYDGTTVGVTKYNQAIFYTFETTIN